MQDVFVVTALEWDGDWILRAEVGEADVSAPGWKSPPKAIDLYELVELVERPNTLVTSKTRSGTVGPTLMVHVHWDGERTVRPIPIAGVPQNLDSILNVIR
jgi:hypothetical protein